MEGNWRAPLVTAIAPIAWGSTYHVSAHLLPTDRPLFASAVRALPAGLLLLAITRTLPRGDWWWRAAALGILNIGLFFPLVFLAAFHLPGGLAATLTATAPISMMLIAWALIRERPTRLGIAGALVGIGGVALLVLRASFVVDVIGVAASLGAVLISSVGYVLVKRWKPPVDMLTFSSWQLIAGGLVLVPVATLVEGAPPAVDARALGGFLYVGLIGTAVAYVAWMSGLRRMPAGAVALIGLLQPPRRDRDRSRAGPRGVRALPGGRHGAGAGRCTRRTAGRARSPAPPTEESRECPRRPRASSDSVTSRCRRTARHWSARSATARSSPSSP